jgi:hypothetical protein
MHFYELSTDPKLFDGDWTDGPKNLPVGYEAVPRASTKKNMSRSPPPFIVL